MQPGPFGLVAWWQLDLVGSAVVALACLVVVPLIAVPLQRHGRLRGNQPAVAFLVIALAFGLQRAVQVSYQAFSLLGDHPRDLVDGQRHPWWLASTQLVVAGIAAFHCIRRRSFAGRLVRAFLSDSSSQQHAGAPDDEHALRQAQVLERERDECATLLQGVLDNSGSVITVKDLDGRYLVVNQPFERATGLAEHAVLGRTDHELTPGWAAAFRHTDQLARAGVHRSQEVRAWPGGDRYVDVTKFPLARPDGTVYATGTIALDMTEEKRAEEVIIEARDAAVAAHAAKSAFLATMSHEIRTPMNAVIGMTELLLGTQLDDQQREFIETVRTSGDALMAVINDILDFSKIEAGALRLAAAPFDLRDEVEGCLDFVAAEASRKGLDLVGHVHDDCPRWVVGDVVRVRQILANLLSNAVKFTERGDVLVGVNVVERSEDRLTLELSVTDTGIGIDTEGLQRLFTSFSQVDGSTTRVYGGTGLGLAISQRLAHAMGGELTVASTPGVGSCFRCVVSVGTCADREETDSGFGLPAALAGRSALVVDDNTTSLRILDLQLSGLGLTCTTVDSAAAALALVDGGQRFDVAILDLHMPGTDGLELGRAIRGRLGDGAPATVLLTRPGWLPDGYERCFHSHLSKPTKRVALQEVLVEVLHPASTDARPGVPAAAGAGPASPLPGSLPPAGQEAPTMQDRVVEEPAPETRSSVALQVLLAEDNLVNQRVAQLMLSKLGYQVRTVATGLAAVEAVERDHYDVVLMDLQMPTMDGLEATRRIRAEVPSDERPYIVAMTASALVEDRDACVAAGMDSYLSKPVRVRDLELVLAGLAARNDER